MSAARLGTARPVLIITCIATTMMGHAIRTGATLLPGHVMWWGLFWLASWSSLYAAVRPTKLAVAFAGAAVITVFFSRALAVTIDAALSTRPDPVTPILAVTAWLLLAYYGGHVFYRLAGRQEA